MAVRNCNVNLNQMLGMNNSLGVFLFYKPLQCSVPKDTSVYKNPVSAGDKQYLMQLVVVCDGLSNVVIVLFGSTSP